MRVDRLTYPSMKTLRGAIHYWGKPPPVKTWGVAAALHAFYDKDVFLKHPFPLVPITTSQTGICVRRGIIKMNMLSVFIGALGGENDHKCMVAVHAEQNIWIDSDIFRSRLPYLAEGIKIGKAAAAVVA